MTYYHFLRAAAHNLRRGGQKALVALACIVFGVAVLVAMTTIAGSIENTLLVEPAQLIGGDLSLVRTDGETLTPGALDQLNSLEQSGAISSYTLIAYNSGSVAFRTPGSGELHYAGIGMGVEPGRYPLAGSLQIQAPGGAALADLLQQAGDTVVTRDLALEYDLHVGDPFLLVDMNLGLPLAGTVRGIAADTPNHQGDKLYYNLETAAALAGGQAAVNTAIVNTSQPSLVADQLTREGWTVDWAAGRRNAQTGNAWVIGLRGAGILGLLVGGIGIANTMKALLRRRQTEIAILKAVGYREGHLRLIFALEAGLLGLAGSMLGSGFGVLISVQVFELLRRSSTVLYQWIYSPGPALIGLLVGTLTTVIFAFWAILAAGQARPAALLRGEPVAVRQAAGCQSVALGLLLLAPFAALASLVMRSAVGGVGALACLGVGIAGMGALFRGILWAFTRLLPLRSFPLAHMAVRSLRRRGGALAFPMIALFIGAVSMGLGLIVSQKSLGAVSSPASELENTSLAVMAAAGQENAVQDALRGLSLEMTQAAYRTALVSVLRAGSSEPARGVAAALTGISDPAGYTLSGASWGSRPEGIYAPQGSGLALGSQVVIAFPDEVVKTFQVVGTYTIDEDGLTPAPPAGLLMTVEGFTCATQPQAVTVWLQVAYGQASRTAADLGAALPQAAVVDPRAYAGRFMHGYRRLYALPLAMAGLALLAGLLLVANSVSLAMVDRRYEIGVLKTAGYTHRDILSIFAWEYGVVGLLASGAGVLALEGLLAVLGLAMQRGMTLVVLTLPAQALVLASGVGLTLLVVMSVTWTPSRLPPVIILRKEE